jgi:hypothetical protein
MDNPEKLENIGNTGHKSRTANIRAISDCSFSILYCLLSSTCVLCTLCCQFLWIVHFWLLVRYSLMFVVLDLCPVYPMLPVFLDCPFLIARSVFSNVWCPWLVSCVPYVASFSGLSGQQTLENTEQAIRNWQSRETGNIGYTGPKSRTTNVREYRVPYVASFSGLSISDCSFGIL